MGKKGDSSDFEHGMVVIANLGFSHTVNGIVRKGEISSGQ